MLGAAFNEKTLDKRLEKLAETATHKITGKVEKVIQNDPAEPIADNGMVVIDKWRDDARKFLASIGEKT